MASDDEVNKVNQTRNEVGNDNAGRDINHTTYNLHVSLNNYPSANDYDALIRVVSRIIQLPDEDIRAIIGERKGNYDTQRVRTSVSMIEAAQNSIFNDGTEEIIAVYLDGLLGTMNKKTQLKMRLAGTLAKEHKFDEAHTYLDELLNEIKPSDDLYRFIYKEYLISGFIAFSRVNNIDGLNLLLKKKKPLHDLEEAEIVYLNIFQEICSRDTDINSMAKAVSELEKIYEGSSGNNKAVMANSLGLSYRRLGERTGLKDLEKAITLFQEGLTLNKDNQILEVELKDQMAITHIRVFEFNKDERQLSIAEDLLLQCCKILKNIPRDEEDARNYRLLPRVLNNLGNVYKQRLLCFQDLKSAAKAITCYEEAEEYWTEQESGYEWAILRKNIADTNYGLSKLLKDPSLLPGVVADCILAMKYRNLENSPFQWAKTVDIVFSAVILLNKLHAIELLSAGTRQEVLAYIDAVAKNVDKWEKEPIFQRFLENTKQADIILKK